MLIETNWDDGDPKTLSKPPTHPPTLHAAPHPAHPTRRPLPPPRLGHLRQPGDHGSAVARAVLALGGARRAAHPLAGRPQPLRLHARDVAQRGCPRDLRGPARPRGHAHPRRQRLAALDAERRHARFRLALRSLAARGARRRRRVADVGAQFRGLRGPRARLPLQRRDGAVPQRRRLRDRPHHLRLRDDRRHLLRRGLLDGPPVVLRGGRHSPVRRGRLHHARGRGGVRLALRRRRRAELGLECELGSRRRGRRLGALPHGGRGERQQLRAARGGLGPPARRRLLGARVLQRGRRGRRHDVRPRGGVPRRDGLGARAAARGVGRLGGRAAPQHDGGGGHRRGRPRARRRHRALARLAHLQRAHPRPARDGRRRGGGRDGGGGSGARSPPPPPPRARPCDRVSREGRGGSEGNSARCRAQLFLSYFPCALSISPTSGCSAPRGDLPRYRPNEGSAEVSASAGLARFLPCVLVLSLCIPTTW
jgi:hypothetical protein